MCRYCGESVFKPPHNQENVSMGDDEYASQFFWLKSCASSDLFQVSDANVFANIQRIINLVKPNIITNELWNHLDLLPESIIFKDLEKDVLVDFLFFFNNEFNENIDMKIYVLKLINDIRTHLKVFIKIKSNSIDKIKQLKGYLYKIREKLKNRDYQSIISDIQTLNDETQ